MGLFGIGSSKSASKDEETSSTNSETDDEFGGRWSALWLFLLVVVIGLIFWIQGVLRQGRMGEFMQNLTSFWGQSEWVLEKE